MRVDNPMLIHTYTLWCVFQGPSAGFPGQLRLGGREGVEKTPWTGLGLF